MYLPCSRVEDARDSGDNTRCLNEPARVEGVALVPQPVDVARTDALCLRQMPGSPALHQEQFDVLLLRERNAGRTQDVLSGLEVQMLGLDQDAVVVPENGFDHEFRKRLKTPRQSNVNSTISAGVWLKLLNLIHRGRAHT